MSRFQKLLLPVALLNFCLFHLYKHKNVYDLSLYRSYCGNPNVSPSMNESSSLPQNQSLSEPNKRIMEESQLPPSSPTSSLPGTTTAQQPIYPAIPPPLPSHIPRKLWYKMGPKGISDDSREQIQNCLKRNPTYRHEFLSDTTAELYVRENYGYRPDVVDAYVALTVPILKADLLRYLILYAEGGVWSDLDVSCEGIPIKKFIPDEYLDRTGLVVGLEFDEDASENGYIGTQFASWWIMSRPLLPHMMMVIDDIIMNLHEIAESNDVNIRGIKWEMIPEVVQVTGPKRLTWSVIRSLEMTLGQPVDDRNVSGLHAPKLVGDVLVMPGVAFAAFQNGEPGDQGPALVSHHYAGSWKNKNGGEMA